MMKHSRICIAICIFALLPTIAVAQQPGQAQDIRQALGVDQSNVRYETLTRLGPWDDRNYQLTRADLDELAPNEEELGDPIPAFFRVEMRKAWPELRRDGPAQYPRSALQIFRQMYTGYQLNGRYYNSAEIRNGRFFVPQTPENLVADVADRFLSGEVRVTSPEGAAESAIKMSPVDTDIIIAGSNGPGAGQKMHFSSDGGESWTQTTLPLGGTCCDPTVDWKSDGSLAHAATLGNCSLTGCGVWYYRSSDNGQTWTDLQNVTPGDPRRELTNSGSDKEFLHVDKSADSAFRDNVYLTWHNSNVMQFARSTDDGNTWATTSFTTDPIGIGSDIVTDRNGRIYYFWPGTSTQQIHLKTSTDGGATFATGTTVIATTNAAFDFPIPSMETRRAWIYVSADADLSDGPFSGSIYAAWTDTTAAESTAANNHARIQVAYSRDIGATWTVVTPHETEDANSVDRWNQWLAVGADGTVHVIFYDTRNDSTRSSVDLYHSFSTDGAATFSTPTRLTSQSSPNISDVFEYGDYNGLDAVMDRTIAVYTDNRKESSGTGDSIDVYATSTPVPATGPGSLADMAVWRPSNGRWYVRLSGGDWNTTMSRQWGTAGDIPLENTDFDGDGKADMAVWRPTNGTWYARLSVGDWNTTMSRQWGTGGDIPLANTDFDGDGKADMGVWRPRDGTWYVRLSGGNWNTTMSRQWGTGGDIPLANTDFDGDGKADMGVWRPRNGTWYVRLSGGNWNTMMNRQWGTGGDIPLANTDFDGDGKADMGVWRPRNGTWYVRLSGADWNSTMSRQWGTAGDIPLPNTDFDGDGKADMGVWRPSNGRWYVRLSGGDWNTTMSRQWGTGGDIPLANSNFDGDLRIPSTTSPFFVSQIVNGKIEAVDPDARTITLDDGIAYTLGEGIAIGELQPGADVQLSYEERYHQNVATDVTPQ